MHTSTWLPGLSTQSLSRACGAGLVVPGYSPEQVEEVRLVLRLLPVFGATILYWSVYAQMGTFFIMQARAGHVLEDRSQATV